MTPDPQSGQLTNPYLPASSDAGHDPTLTELQRIRLLEIGQRMVVAQQAEVAVAMRAVEECLRKGESRMGTMETELTTNSKVTVEVRDILSTAKGAFKFFGILGLVIKWVGGIAAACTSLYVLFYMATHGGKPPGA